MNQDGIGFRQLDFKNHALVALLSSVMSPAEGDNLKDRISSRGEEALSEVAQALLDNPVFSQVLQSAFGAREAAGQVTAQAMRNVGFATQADLERLERRVRSISDRIEAVEDRLDSIGTSASKSKAAGSATKSKATKSKTTKSKSTASKSTRSKTS